MQTANFLKTFREDKAFLKGFLLLSLPIGLQSMLTSVMNTLASLMVGQLGDLQVSATTLAGQIFFILNLVIVGIVSGSTIFLSQYYGKGDYHNLKIATSVAFALVIAVSTLFTIIGLLFPRQLLSIFSNEPEVIELASNYLYIVCISYLPTGISLACTMFYRNMGRPALPLRITIAMIVVDIAFSYVLIFGYFGFPKLGIYGAAIAIVLSRFIEMIITTWIMYAKFRAYAPTIKDLLAVRKSFLILYTKTSLPVILNETIWSIGYALYNVVFFHMGYTIGAAVGIAKVLEQLLIAFFIGTGQAAAIILGQTIGEGKPEKAPYYANRMSSYTALSGIVIGIIMIVGTPLFLLLYQGISDTVRDTVILIMIYLACIMPLKGMNFIHIMGTLRAGGDTKMCFIIDNVALWCVSLPLTFLTGYIFNLGIEVVFLFVVLDDVCKYLLVRLRIRSNKWIHNLVE